MSLKLSFSERVPINSVVYIHLSVMHFPQNLLNTFYEIFHFVGQPDMLKSDNFHLFWIIRIGPKNGCYTFSRVHPFVRNKLFSKSVYYFFSETPKSLASRYPEK